MGLQRCWLWRYLLVISCLYLEAFSAPSRRQRLPSKTFPDKFTSQTFVHFDDRDTEIRSSLVDRYVIPRRTRRLQNDIREIPGVDDPDRHKKLAGATQTNSIFFKIDNASFDGYPEHDSLIRKSLSDWESATCLTFTDTDTLENKPANFLNFLNKPGFGCTSIVGFVQGQQDITLQAPGCLYASTVDHEIGHALGLIHEQGRSIRDDFVIVHPENLEDKLDRLAFRIGRFQRQTNIPYDYTSVMHYAENDFSPFDARARTLKTRYSVFQNIIGKVPGLSFYDAKTVSLEYGCDSGCPTCVNEGFSIKNSGGDCQCVCPTGLTGPTCAETTTQATCGGVFESIYGAGRELPFEHPVGATHCVWLIRTLASNVRLTLTVTSAFMKCPNEEDLFHFPAHQSLQIRAERLGQSGPYFCGSGNSGNLVNSDMLGDHIKSFLVIMDLEPDHLDTHKVEFVVDVLSDGCADDPCLNGAKCTTISDGSFRCDCPLNTESDTCAILGEFEFTCRFPEGLCPYMESDLNRDFLPIIDVIDRNRKDYLFPPVDGVHPSDYFVIGPPIAQGPNRRGTYMTTGLFTDVGSERCLTFQHYTKGENQFCTLNVITISEDNTKEQLLWSFSGTQVTVWPKVEVTIPSVSPFDGLRYRLAFEWATSKTARETNSIAVDNIDVSMGACANPDDCFPNPCQNSGACTDTGTDSFLCTCATGFIGETCLDVDECAVSPCENGGTCADGVDTFTCSCVTGFDGATCDNNIDDCATNPCLNGGACQDGVNSFTCDCTDTGFEGNTCNNNIDECTSNPCINGGTCLDEVNSFTCSCSAGFNGTTCDNDIDECASNPCQNGGTCLDEVNSFTCSCATGFNGTMCDNNIDDCSANSCLNDGACQDGVNSFTCDCTDTGFEGNTCGTDIDECSSNPCTNGGTCLDEVNSFTCSCSAGFNGTTCDNNIDDCSANSCLNGGACQDGVNSFTCDCTNTGFEGSTCGTDIDECASNPCKNGGTCLDEVNSFTCSCSAGFNGTTCDNDINDCVADPCKNGGTCQDEVNSFTCSCSTGFNGTTCDNNIDDCAFEPCESTGRCVDGVDSFTCECDSGFGGETCQNTVMTCSDDPCENGASCQDKPNIGFVCECLDGFNGTECEINIDECASNPCKNGGTCQDEVNSFTCSCVTGFNGTTCNKNIDECASNPCENGGTCQDEVNSFTCSCATGFNGTTCDNDIDDCSANSCLNGGACQDGVNSFTCDCTNTGFEGSTCGTDIDECASNPCQNGGTCLDEVNSFTCSCSAGFNGTTCDNNVDDCASNPCLNGGACEDGVNSFTCDCTNIGFEGNTCGTDIDECTSNPCKNGGTCLDEVNGFTCSCVTGFNGTTCDNNIDDCSANSCGNGGTCSDTVGGFTCACVSGFTDDTCQTNIDECASNPCNNGGTCLDEVNGFACSCSAGFNGTTCDNNIDDCSPSPCLNNGVCTDSINEFLCTCTDGFSGDTCADNIDECTLEPCKNGGTCNDGIAQYTCECSPGFGDDNCTTDIDECVSAPCQNEGTCTDAVNGFNCTCPVEFTGDVCQTNADDCAPEPCKNGGTCVDGVAAYNCSCLPGYTDQNCTTDINECESNPCQFGGTCQDLVNAFQCTCASGFSGPTCVQISSLGCTFEDTANSLCGMANFGKLEWTAHQGSTAAFLTGPSSAKEGDRYAYLKGGSGNTGESAMLTQAVPLAGTYCIQFYYFMRGAGIGQLRVGTTATGTTFTVGGPRGRSWHKAYVEITPTSASDSLFFEAVVGQTAARDIAIDDVLVEKRPCSLVKPTTLTVCGFEAGTCGLMITGENYRFEVAELSDSGTGSSSPLAKSFQQVLEFFLKRFGRLLSLTQRKPLNAVVGAHILTASASPGEAGSETRLILAYVTEADFPVCLSFFYHMGGLSGTLSVESTDSSGVISTLMSETGFSGFSWQPSISTIKQPKGFGPYELSLKAVRGGTFLLRSDISVDEVELKVGACG